MKTDLYDQFGRRLGEYELPDAVFAAPVREDIVHLCVTAQLAAARAGTAKAKNRAAVSGGGRKPYRQKGTGHARQGSIRAPQWRGGGVVFGPVPRTYEKKIPKKVRHAAFRAVLSDKAARNMLRVIDKLVFDEYRTRGVVEMLDGHRFLDAKVLFILENKNEKFAKSADNLPTVEVRHVGNASVYEIVAADALVVTAEAARMLGEKYAE